MLAWAHSLQMRRKSRYHIRNDRQLYAFLYDLRLLGSWRLRLSLLRPQAIVAKLSDSLWQHCVSAVSEQVAIVLIDISDPTPNLQWEIEHSRRAALRCVFIAESGRLRSWMESGHQSAIGTVDASSSARDPSPDIVAPSNGAAGSAAESVAQLLGDDWVLLYDGDQRLGGASFQRGLRQLLLKASAQPPQRSTGITVPLMDRLWRLSLAAIYHGLIFFVAMASGVFVGTLLTAATK
jgi:hypothetical protein